MLDFPGNIKDTWNPPYISEKEMQEICSEYPEGERAEGDFLIIFKTKPYIDGYQTSSDN